MQLLKQIQRLPECCCLFIMDYQW